MGPTCGGWWPKKHGRSRQAARLQAKFPLEGENDVEVCGSVLVDDAIEFLGRSARRAPLLSREQEINLGRLIRHWQDWPGGPVAAPAGVARKGKRALDRFVESNLRLALMVARRFRGRGVPLEDLAQSAAEGIHRGAMRFDPSLGYRPSSYLTWYATQQCQLLCSRQGGAITLPAHASEKIRLIQRAQEELRQELRREPGLEDVARRTGLKPSLVERLLLSQHQRHAVSLDAAAAAGTADGLLGQMTTGGPLEDLTQEDDSRQLRQLLQALLDPVERCLVEQLHLAEEPQTLARMASRLNLSRRRCRQVEARALAQLRSLECA